MAKVIRTATFFIFIILALPGIASDKQAILFKDSSGQTILKYHKLSVSDAEGRKVPAYMTVADASVAIVADDRYAVYPLIIDPIIEYEKKIIASYAAAGDHFGNSVSVSGDTVVVGAPSDDDKYLIKSFRTFYRYRIPNFQVVTASEMLQNY